MRIIVMSDSHNNYFAVEKIVRRNLDADMFIHLGDGENDVDRVILRYPEVGSRFIHVRGNCDTGSFSQNCEVICAGSHKIFAAHGHLYGVYGGLEILRKNASANGCDIILYGHTHARFQSYEDGVYVMNPGSASSPRDGNLPSFGCIDISEAGVVTHIVEV